MRAPFCIIKTLGDGSPHFVEAVQTLAEAKARIEGFARLWPGEYVIFDRETGELVSPTAGDEEA